MKRSLVALSAGIAVIAAVIWLGQLAKHDLRLNIDQLEVASPPGMTRGVFLAEVVHESGLPSYLDRTDPKTVDQLKAAFAKHPWVESVEVGDLKAAQPVSIRLRMPTLVVAGRVLDRHGVVLPLRTPTATLPEYRGASTSANNKSGRPFADPAVVEAAQRVGLLREKLPSISWKFAEQTPDGLVLTKADGSKMIWGKNAANEPSANEKIAKLQHWLHGDIDLRK